MMSMPSDILDAIQGARLPSPPQVLLGLLRAFQEPDLSYARLAQMVGQDPALTARVLGVANSARYGRGRRIVGIEQSLIALGTETTRALVLSAAMQQVFNGFPSAAQRDLAGFWREALNCAAVARQLAVEAGYANPEEAYLAGLLHDVGRLALLAAVPERYGPCFDLPEDDPGLIEAEIAAVGCHHAEAGAWLVGRWNLMSFLADAVRYHHEPPQRVAGAHDLVRLVLVANGLMWGDEQRRASYLHAAQRFFGLGADQVTALLDKAGQRVREVAENLGIVIDRARPDAGAASEQAARALEAETRRNAVVGALRPLLGGGAAELVEALGRCVRLLPLPVEEVCIALAEPSGTTLRVQPLQGQDPRLAELVFMASADGGVLGQALAGGEPVDSFARKAAGELAVEDRQLLDLVGCPGLLAVPIRSGDRVVAVLALATTREGVDALRAELPLLQALAGIAGPLLGRGPAAPEGLRGEREVAVRAGVHEAGNRLGIIRNGLRILALKAGAESGLKPGLDALDEEVQRVGNILQRLVDGADQPGSRQAVDLNRLVREEVLLYTATLVKPGGPQLRMELDPQLPTVAADGDLLRQALLNLVKNAVEAMPQGGEVTVSTWAGVNQGGAQFVALTVSDRGPGLPRQVLDRLFQPVQSTKGGEHAGLGLAVTRGLVDTLGGVITCRSAAGRGTSIEILLPQTPAAGQ